MKQNVLYKRDALLAFKDSDKDMKKWSIDMFAVFLHSHYPKSPAKAEEMAVKSKEEELDFPTLEDVSFVDLRLASGKAPTTGKTHPVTPSQTMRRKPGNIRNLVTEVSISSFRQRLKG